MQVLFAVLDDLFRFALQSLFGFVESDKRNSPQALPSPLQSQLPLPSPAPVPFLSEGELVSAYGSYFVSTPKAAVRVDPVVAFDNVVMQLPYGTQLSLLKYGGRWALVQVGEFTGWMLKDDIRSAASEVFPVLTHGVAYNAADPETKKLRLYIDDAFGCSLPDLPLMATEYVTYRLARSRRTIGWPDTRPRLPGLWQSILRGRQGIHIGVTPKTGAVMEYSEEEVGHLLYVEAVFPDESIQVSAVDQEGLGVYSESVFTKEVWRELRPVFIEIL